MRLALTYLLSFVVLVWTIPALAQDTSKCAAEPKTQRVQLIPDQTQGRLRINIDGRDVAFFDANGLNIRGDLKYGGSLVDFGSIGYDQAQSKTSHAR